MILWYNSHISLTVFQFFVHCVHKKCMQSGVSKHTYFLWLMMSQTIVSLLERRLCRNGWLVLSQNLCSIIIFHIIRCRKCFCHLVAFPSWRCTSRCWFKHSAPYSIAYVWMHVMCQFMAQWWQEVTHDCCWIKYGRCTLLLDKIWMLYIVVG